MPSDKKRTFVDVLAAMGAAVSSSAATAVASVWLSASAVAENESTWIKVVRIDSASPLDFVFCVFLITCCLVTSEGW